MGGRDDCVFCYRVTSVRQVPCRGLRACITCDTLSL